MEREDREDCDDQQDKVDHAWNCTFKVRYDGLQDKVDYTHDDQSIDHEDCTFGGQTFETQLGVQVNEDDYDQPIDYPDTINFISMGGKKRWSSYLLKYT